MSWLLDKVTQFELISLKKNSHCIATRGQAKATLQADYPPVWSSAIHRPWTGQTAESARSWHGSDLHALHAGNNTRQTSQTKALQPNDLIHSGPHKYTNEDSHRGPHKYTKQT